MQRFRIEIYLLFIFTLGFCFESVFLTPVFCASIQNVGKNDTSNAESHVLFHNGQTVWTVKLLQPGDETLAYAAAELQRALKCVSGADFPLEEGEKTVQKTVRKTDSSPVPNQSPARNPALNSALSPNLAQIQARNPVSDASEIQTPSGTFEHPRIYIGVEEKLRETPDVISIETRTGSLYLTGGSARSALYAVYEFLRSELGVRWLWPGTDGEFMPPQSEYVLPELHRVFTPAIPYRGFHMCGDWYNVQEFHEWAARNLLNIHRHGNCNFPDRPRGFYRMYSSHNVFPPKEYFGTHPEYFALRNGTRIPQQVCLSNRGGLKVIAERLAAELNEKPDIDVLSLFLPDNQEYCQCPECASKSVSDAFFDFYNGLTDILHAQFPDLKFATLAYQGYLDVPKNPVRNSVFVEIATHGRCNIHTYHDPQCERNVGELKRFCDWKASGVPVGNYAYEYDLFSREFLFLPFFTLADDLVKTNVELGSVVLIPEVCLSPRNGPEEVVGTCTNRISEYLIARLMSEPEADWHELLRDYCDYAYGPAAVPVYEYLLAFDAQWQKIPSHRGILGSPAGLAEELITPEILQTAANRFAEAEKALADSDADVKSDPALSVNSDVNSDKISDKKSSESAKISRFRANLQRERVLFSQWLRFTESGERFDVPHVQNVLPLSEASSAAAGTAVPGLKVRLCWTDDALILRGSELPLELALSTGLCGETWYFRVEKDGSRSTWRVTDVGVKDTSWSPEWHCENGVITIPFASLAEAPPTPKTLWQFRISDGTHAYPERNAETSGTSDSFAGLIFSSAAKTGRVLAYWTGSRERDEKNFPLVRSTFRDGGWNAHIAANEEEFLSLEPDAFWLKNPSFIEKLPDSCWEKVRKSVEDGALAVFVSYSALPLGKYFGDSSWKVTVRGISEPISLSERRSNFLLPGDWQTVPFDLTRSLTQEITPAYALYPDEPERWQILATMPRSAAHPEERLVYMALRKYGKGTVLIMGADPRIPFPLLLDNILNMSAEK